MIKTYYELTKPGIIYGNALTLIGGFFLAANGHPHLILLLLTLLGSSLVIASGCVCNNYLDRDIDPLMERTRDRALARGLLSGRQALTFATILGVLGALVIGFATNLLTLLVIVGGFVVYVFLYAYYKRRSIHGTLVGSIAGAVPPLVGYTTVTGRIGLEGLILFLIIAVWQMPHFYAIALYRLADYSAAKLPVLPIVKGVQSAKVQILAYIVALALLFSALTFFHFTGYVYAGVMVLLSLTWLLLGVRHFRNQPAGTWGRQMFLFSLVVVTVFSLMISVNSFLP